MCPIDLDVLKLETVALFAVGEPSVPDMELKGILWTVLLLLLFGCSAY